MQTLASEMLGKYIIYICFFHFIFLYF